jgi:diaminopimelate epimerase
MQMKFYKYQGTGNDFIILDNRDGSASTLSNERVKFLCDRHMGIGADGLMLLSNRAGYDFEMTYYNSDGNPGSMCGNGGRCLVKFAYDQGMHKSAYRFIAADGVHEAEIEYNGIVNLKMKDVREVLEFDGDRVLNTGSPHYVKFVTDVMNYDVIRRGKEIRNSTDFAEQGINVNFVEQKGPDKIVVRTYERGVEDETLSCGTGVTACAVVCYHNDCGYNDVTVITRGGKLTVKFDRPTETLFENIWLCGPAEKVFEGSMDILGRLSVITSS